MYHASKMFVLFNGTIYSLICYETIVLIQDVQKIKTIEQILKNSSSLNYI